MLTAIVAGLVPLLLLAQDEESVESRRRPFAQRRVVSLDPDVDVVSIRLHRFGPQSSDLEPRFAIWFEGTVPFEDVVPPPLFEQREGWWHPLVVAIVPAANGIGLIGLPENEREERLRAFLEEAFAGVEVDRSKGIVMGSYLGGEVALQYALFLQEVFPLVAVYSPVLLSERPLDSPEAVLGHMDVRYWIRNGVGPFDLGDSGTATTALRHLSKLRGRPEVLGGLYGIWEFVVDEGDPLTRSRVDRVTVGLQETAIHHDVRHAIGEAGAGIAGMFEFASWAPLEPHAAMVDEGDDEFPVFPWPPPRPSAREIVPRRLYVSSQTTTFGDVAAAVEGALRTAGHPEVSYYAVPDGFALVSTFEQIDGEGVPLEPPDRWSVKIPPLRRFGLMSYLGRLLRGQRGHYRLVVFVVTSQSFEQSAEVATRKKVEDWLAGGHTGLSDELAATPFTANHDCHALIYEFRRSAEDSPIEPLVPASRSVREHLKKAAIIREW